MIVDVNAADASLSGLDCCDTLFFRRMGSRSVQTVDVARDLD